MCFRPPGRERVKRAAHADARDSVTEVLRCNEGKRFGVEVVANLFFVPNSAHGQQQAHRRRISLPKARANHAEEGARRVENASGRNAYVEFAGAANEGHHRTARFGVRCDVLQRPYESVDIGHVSNIGSAGRRLRVTVFLAPNRSLGRAAR
jgi:hypothetical protein